MMRVFDDSDIKIAPDRPSEIFDTSEGAANAFVREKSNGNMEKARVLGTRFAQELLSGCRHLALLSTDASSDEQLLTQCRILFAYIVNKTIADTAPNSIVAQSALSAFYETLQRQNSMIYDQINDSAVFSMYILSGRSAPGDLEAVGRVFAKLCRAEGQAEVIERGRILAEKMTAYCTQCVYRADFIHG